MSYLFPPKKKAAEGGVSEGTRKMLESMLGGRRLDGDLKRAVHGEVRGRELKRPAQFYRVRREAEAPVPPPASYSGRRSHQAIKETAKAEGAVDYRGFAGPRGRDNEAAKDALAEQMQFGGTLASLQPAGAGSERDDAIRATADKLLEEVAVRRAFLEDQKAQGRAPEEFESVRQGIYERLDRLDALVGARASR